MQIIFPLTTRISASPTYEQPDFAIVDSRFHIFSRAKSTCTASAGKFLSNMRQPLSSASANLQNLPLAASFGCCGNKRYNTLDFPRKVVCQQGCYSPLLETQSQEMRLACRLGQCFKMLRILRSPPETRTPLDTLIFSSKMVSACENTV